MSQAPFLTLPQELIDEIVDCISDSNYDWGNKPNILRACASVCRSFRPRAQTRLFSQLRFWACDAKQLAGKVDRLDAVLHDNPHLASHVRSLCFEVQSSTIAIFHYPVLFCIVSMITQATSQLGLPSKTIIHGHGQSSDYGSHPSQFCDNRALNAQLVQPFLAPYITSMELCGLTNVPIELVTSCRSLRKLELCDVTLEASDREAIDPMLRPRLDEFTFKECGHDTIRYLVDYYLDFRYLLRLESSGDPIEDSDDLRYILDVCADSLEELSLTCSELFTDYPPFDFALLIHDPLRSRGKLPLRRRQRHGSTREPSSTGDIVDFRRRIRQSTSRLLCYPQYTFDGQ
ncbi:hypothetical protein BDZ97DRAFT_1155727 [Flammula alnicola]|nr:hypothetical protein BDZ97DRAFT_1155727 [Flammula alnicola]